jgi:hypothetical protein
MAWLETDRHGRLRSGFKYYDGLKCREPLGVSANQQTIAEARRLCATIQFELKAKTFDYAKRFPDSDRVKQRGIETPEKIEPISVTELAHSWLLSKQGEVKKIHPRLLQRRRGDLHSARRNRDEDGFGITSGIH